jgi:hypothetical protein
VQKASFHISDLESFLAKLTPRIQTDLPGWYGNDARIIGSPEFRAREWSSLFRYAVRFSEVQTRVVLAKVRHVSEVDLENAVASRLMKNKIEYEYKTLLRIEQIFEEERSPTFFTIHPLAYYEDLNAIVMEEADIIPLRSYFKGINMWSEEGRRSFGAFLDNAGQWLRIYHDGMGEIEEGCLFSEKWFESTLTGLRIIEAANIHLDLKFIHLLLENLYKKYCNMHLPYKFLHNDFNCANVFVTKEGKIGSLDPQYAIGPVYTDLAKIITDMETCRVQVLTNGMKVPSSIMETFSFSLLKGYFKDEPFDPCALDLFRLLYLIKKWSDDENKLKQSTGKKFLYYLGALEMRNYFLRHVREKVKCFQ